MEIITLDIWESLYYVKKISTLNVCRHIYRTCTPATVSQITSFITKLQPKLWLTCVETVCELAFKLTHRETA